MPIIATSGGTETTYEPVPAGSHIARCFQIIHIGTIPVSYQGETLIQNKVRIGFEIPDELRTFKEGEPQRPMMIAKDYTLSTHEHANLRKDLDSWRGKAMTDEEAAAFDIEKLLGVPAMITVVHKPSKDGKKTYANIAGISPLPKSIKCPDPINEPRILSFDDFDYEYFETLPDYLKEKIRSSEEYAALSYSPTDEVNIDDVAF